jgi:hypothetical protein
MRRYRTEKSVTEKSVSRVLWPLEAPPMCPRPTPGVGSTAYTRKKRVEWLARYRFRYLTNLTNSRVRSSHPFHTKSPFSRFFGGRRQKSENIMLSARGRRRPQAPTLRFLGCANARKGDYKSSSLYSQSTWQRTRRRTQPRPRLQSPVRQHKKHKKHKSACWFLSISVDFCRFLLISVISVVSWFPWFPWHRRRRRRAPLSAHTARRPRFFVPRAAHAHTAPLFVVTRPNATCGRVAVGACAIKFTRLEE